MLQKWNTQASRYGDICQHLRLIQKEFHHLLHIYISFYLESWGDKNIITVLKTIRNITKMDVEPSKAPEINSNLINEHTYFRQRYYHY